MRLLTSSTLVPSVRKEFNFLGFVLKLKDNSEIFLDFNPLQKKIVFCTVSFLNSCDWAKRHSITSLVDFAHQAWHKTHLMPSIGSFSFDLYSQLEFVGYRP